MNEKQMNSRLEELQASFDRKIPGYTREVKKAFDLARIGVMDVVAKHSTNGKLPKSKQAAVSRDLAAVETQLYRNLLSQTTIIIDDAAQTAGNNVNEALIAVVGISAILALQEQEEGSVAVLTASVLTAIGIGLLEFVAAVTKTVFARKGDDSKDLRYRLRILAADIITDVRRKLRQTTGKSEEIAAIQAKVAESFEGAEWRLERITETEAPVAYRTAIAHAAEKSGLVAGLRIIDFPHGEARVHEKHKCYLYARADEHGMGKGVYPVTNRKIRNPHPQCRSRLLLVLKEGVLNA